jgi:hypothetical protein
LLIPILIAVAAIVVIFIVVVSLQPGKFRLERSTSIATPAAIPFANVNDFHRWKAWSPWENIDANLKRTYEGPAAGVGSTYSWVGKKAGTGRMTILESRSNQLIKIQLEFFKPFRATNTVDFIFIPDGNQTAVKWAMYGPNSFIAKFIHMLCSMDKMVGPSFEEGLAKLKTVSESGSS